VDHRVSAAIVLAQFMYLGMTVVTARNTIISPGCLDLLVFHFPVFQPLLFKAGLEKAAAAAAAVVVRPVGGHVDKVFLPHNRFDHIPEIFGNRIPIAFPDDLARVLNGKLDLSILVPVRIDLQFAFADPAGVIFVDAFDFKIVFEVEFFQSGPD